MIKDKQLAWGVSFEIARLMSKGQITTKMVIPQKLEQLRGLNKDAAPHVIRVFANASTESGVDHAFTQEIMANVSPLSCLLTSFLTTYSRHGKNWTVRRKLYHWALMKELATILDFQDGMAEKWSSKVNW